MPKARSWLRVACLQMSAGENMAANLAKAFRMIRTAADQGAKLACLPEMFCYRGRAAWLSEVAENLSSPLIESFRKLALRCGIGILLGSFVEQSKRRDRYYNTSVLISEKGAIAGVYRKIHLFEIRMKGEVECREADHILAGKKITLGRLFGIPVGFSICYDIRFPELYRRLAEEGAQIFFAPANFTEKTGRAHWEVLLRARAIENQAFVVAPAQVGKNPATGIWSFGSSLIIDPWGKVLNRASRAGEEIVMANLDLKSLSKLRKEFPVLTHGRPNV